MVRPPLPCPAFLSLSGRVALVTGASRGLGFAMARALGQAGATVVLNSRSEAELAACAATLQAEGISCDYAVFDITDRDAATASINAIAQKQGRLDILLANAGLVNRAPLGEWTHEAWDKVVNTNLRAALFLAQAALPHIRKHGVGRLIFTSSITGILGRGTIHAYVASKSGLAGLTRSLAAELGHEGITANSIAPGYFETELNAPLLADAAFVARVKNRTALKRWGKPEELGGLAVMLASDAGAYITGQQIAVDGGITGTM